MSSNFHKEEEGNADLHLRLSEKYMAYKDLSDRCLISTKNIEKGESRVFYLQPSSPFLQEPRKQNQFKNEFIRSIGQAPSAQPLTFIADDLHKAYIEQIGDQSNPTNVKNELCNFFKRRQYKLQHKRYKLLLRWAHYCLTSEKIDKASLRFNPAMSKIQFELENCVQRYTRLEGQDHFQSAERPQQQEGSSYADDGDRPPLSSLRQDDVDVYFRIITYEERITRNIEKLIQRIKLTPLSHRFEIYSESIQYFQDMRNKSILAQKKESEDIQRKGDILVELKKLGDQGTKELQQIIQSKTVFKQENKLQNNKDIFMSKCKYNYEMPPMIQWNEVELKMKLLQLSKIYKIVGDMDKDNGHTFSFSVITFFPNIFSVQVVKNQFAPYDALPSMINPANLGQKNIKKVLKRNQKKYGRTQGGNTLLEKIEIEKHSKEIGIEFLNSVENSLFGKFNAGQLDNFPSVRIKQSDWIDLICFKPELDNEQMHQSAVLSGENNWIDECLANFLEILNVNDLPNINLIMESISQIHYDKLKYGSVKTDFLNFDPNDSDTFFTENQKQFLSLFSGCLKSKADFDINKPSQEISQKSFYDLPSHLLLATYLLQYLGAREQKTKLLYTLNTFRSIQRRMTIELREMGTRDKVLGDALLIMPKEQKAESSISEENSTSDESKNDPDAIAEEKENINITKDPLIDINKYKFGKALQNYLNSTCPVVPKFHSTYGQPIDRQEISKDIDHANINNDQKRFESKKLLGRIDYIYKNEECDLNLVKDDFGIHIIYDSAFADMRMMELEILKICSFYINKAEPLLDNDLKNMYPCVDRLRILDEVIEYENKFQEGKLDLITAYLECYEHISDSLEQQRIIQIIVDEMARRPKLNLSGSHFKDSYTAEIECLHEKTNLVREVIKLLMNDEFKINESIRVYIEKSFRLLHEQIQGRYKYVQPEDLEQEMNKREIKQTGKGGIRNSKNDKLMQSEIENGRKIDTNEVEINRRSVMSKHEAEQDELKSLNFADPQEFAFQIGVPFDKLELILKDHHERDHLVRQSVHENVSFIKITEGYPQYIIKNAKDNLKFKTSKNSKSIEVLDFYEGLHIIPKFIASIQRAFKELIECHRPDNGLMVTAIEIQTIKFIKAELEVVKNQSSLVIEKQKGQNYIEDDTIAGNSDYMLFLAKELAASKEDPQKAQNPFVVAKLDIKSILKFNFRQYQGYIDQNDQKSNQKEVINLSDRITKKSFGKFYPKVKGRCDDLNIPSMLTLTCNSYELLRLRNVLILTLEQASVLEDVYEKQVKLIQKEGRVQFKDPFNFQNYVANAGENFIDFVEDGPGDDIKIQLSINEFDPKIRSSLNFMDSECIKALLMPMGLEEFRTVVQYEVMNLQALIVGTKINQILLDNSQRKLCEINFFEKGYTIANPVFNLLQKLQLRANLSEQNLRKLPGVERSELMQQIQQGVGEIYYNIIIRKQKMKEFVEKTFKAVKNSQSLLRDQKVEITQKQLRATKIILCHDYCQDILSRIYQDSIKLQILYETDILRKRAYLLPRESIFFQLFPFKYGEHQFANYNEDHQGNIPKEQTLFYDKNENKIQGFWRIPSNKEIMEIDIDYELFKKLNLPRIFQYDLGNISEKILPEFICDDPLLKIVQKIPKVTLTDSKDIDNVLKSRQRLVEFAEAYDYFQSSKSVQYLQYFKSISNIYDLEFFANKLASSANSMCNVEKMVLSGVPFWEEGDDSLFGDMEGTESQEEEETAKEVNKKDKFKKKGKDNDRFPQGGHRPLKNVLALKVAEKVANEKRQKMQLIQDLESIKDLFVEYEQIMKKQETQGNMQRAISLLQDFQQIKYYGILFILYQMQDTYYKDKKGQKEIIYFNEYIQKLSNQHDMKVTYNNGFHVNYAITATERVFLDSNSFNQDYDNFFKATQPMIDEDALNPPEYNLISGIYLTNSKNIVTFKKDLPYVGAFPARDYSCLDFAMTNLSKDIRRYFMQNINSNEQTLQNFIKAYSKLNEIEYQSNPTVYQQILQDKKNFLKVQVRARQQRRIYIILKSQKMIPLDIDEYNQVFSEYYEEMLWKINHHIDGIQKNRAVAAEREMIRQKAKNPAGYIQANNKSNQDSSVLKQYDQAQSEIEVIQNETSRHMIKTSYAMFERETQALSKVFEMTNLKVQAFIHPSQQFAATFYTKIDNRNHLDIINKVGAIQKMLTQIKNRCLEIQTLTSGVGVVISSKDLTECLEECCRALIKYGEIEMRTRCEQLYNQMVQYENLIYVKDQQLINMENKLKTAKQEINKIVNAKVFSRGNNLVYELDMTNRQLRFMKDSIFLMEKNLTDKIKLCYDKELDMTRMQLSDVRKGLKEYQEKVAEQIKTTVRENVNTIDGIVKQKANKYKDLSIQTKMQDKFDEFKSKQSNMITNTTINIENMVINKNGEVSMGGTDPKLLEELEELKKNEKEARDHVLKLQDVIRKYRIMNKFKEILTAEKHSFKIDNLKQQLTSNTALWEQLAESEKREKILKQEIERAQQEIATQEKIIERLKDDIKKEGLEKQKLLQYKNTKSKRLDELESKAREFEVLSSVNLGKILSLLESKEKKINELTKNDGNINEYINAIVKLNQQELNSVKQKASEETHFKIEAMTKLESLRHELQMIQGSDQVSVSFWKEQCQSLFEICKNLKEDNEKLVENIGSISDSAFVKKNSIQQMHPLDQFTNNQDLLNYLNQTPKIQHTFEQQSKIDSLLKSNHKRGFSQQLVDNSQNSTQRADYEKVLFGFDKNLQDHMLGLNRKKQAGSISRQRQNLVPGQSFNSFLSDNFDQSGQSNKLALPKINFNNQKFIGSQFVDQNLGSIFQGGNARIFGQQNPFTGKQQVLGFNYPNNVFSTLNNQMHLNELDKSQSGEIQGISNDRTTIMTNNQSKIQNSISQNKGNYENSNGTQRNEVEQFGGAPLTQRVPPINSVIKKNNLDFNAHRGSHQVFENNNQKMVGYEDSVQLQTLVQSKLIQPSSKLTKTIEYQGVRGALIKKKSLANQ